MDPELSKSMTEDELLQAITEAATYLGWRWHHVRRSDKAQQMGHSGFPDLVLARFGEVLFLELKSDKGRMTGAQTEWHFALGIARAHLVRPEDLDDVLRMLR